MTITATVNAPTYITNSILTDTGNTITLTVNDAEVITRLDVDVIEVGNTITASVNNVDVSTEEFLTIRPTTSTGTWTNETLAYDADIDTFAYNPSSNSVETWSGLSTTETEFASVELNVSYDSITGTDSDTFLLEYSLDGGSSWETPIWSGTCQAITKTTFNVALGIDQDISDIQVRGEYDRNAPLIGTYTLRVFEIWVDAEVDNSNQNIIDTGVTITATANEVSVVGDSLVVDTGSTATFTCNTAVASIQYPVTIIDTGSTIVTTANLVTVTTEVNAIITDTGNTITATVNTATVILDSGFIDVTGNVATFTVNAPTLQYGDAVAFAQENQIWCKCMPVTLTINGEDATTGARFNQQAHLTKMRIRRDSGYY